MLASRLGYSTNGVQCSMERDSEGSSQSTRTTCSPFWTLFEPSYARMIKPNSSTSPGFPLHWNQERNMLGFGRSQGYDQPAEGWYQPDRNNT